MTGALSLIAASAALTCSPSAIAPFVGHWVQAGSPQNTLDINRHGASVIVTLKSPNEKSISIIGIQTVDGRIVVPINSNMSTILTYNSKNKTINGGDHIYVHK